MQTADFDHSSFEQRQQAEEDKKLLVKFYIKAVQDQKATLREGRPVFHDVEYIDIRIPGDRGGGVARPASFKDKQRFPEHYAAFKNRTEATDSGTPLIEWPLISRSMAEELAFFNVKTVEHLADMPDVHASKFMGMQAMKLKAKKWLEQATDEAKVHELQQELLERDERIAEQGRQIAALQDQMTQLLADKPGATWPSGHQMQPPAADAAPSLQSDLDDNVADEPAEEETPPAPAAKKAARKRRSRAVTPDGEVQDDK